MIDLTKTITDQNLLDEVLVIVAECEADALVDDDSYLFMVDRIVRRVTKKRWTFVEICGFGDLVPSQVAYFVPHMQHSESFHLGPLDTISFYRCRNHNPHSGYRLVPVFVEGK